MELVRVILGLIAAVLLPYSIPALRTRTPLALSATGLYAGYALLPVFFSWVSAVLIPLCVASSWVLTSLAKRDEDMQRSPRILVSARVRKFTLAPLGLVGLTTATALAVLGLPEMLGAARELILDDRVMVLISGFLIATFIGGEVVTHMLHPFSAELRKAETEEMAPLKGAGTVIGWLERSLTYIFVVTGRAEAVAVVVAIKALARFPELQANQKRFAEYFLIGTMSSIGVALLAAAVVRVALGEEALN
ncbi:hypothetical protein [Nocardiopsis trehalosi]|jgi:hypothetical protein|uniref:hypothetical protein n=1 Tax=Nocardiopsis trehalosi TaxID=109329 RepID=UPI0008365796|nr:hypothetical protein [Nocardiopsis trehalosi]